MKNKTNLFPLLLVSLLLQACNDKPSEIIESSSNTKEQSSEVSSILSSSIVESSESSSSIEVKNYAFSIENKQVYLTSDQNSTYDIVCSKTVNEVDTNEGITTYKSLDESIAKVNESGKISYEGLGRTRIEVTWKVEENEFKDYVVVDCFNQVSFENINTLKTDYITTQGRVSKSSTGLALNNSATGIDLAFKGSQLTMKFKASSTNCYIHVYLDDDTEGTLIKISSIKEKEYTLFEGLENTFHKVRIIKASSPQYGIVYITGFVSDVTYYQAPLKELTIEFLGDSISCGYGNLGNNAVSASSSNQDAGLAFPYLTALALDANFSVLALEGICAKDGATNIYNSYSKYSATSSNSDYDPKSYDADIVVIGLGENDMWHATSSQFSYTVDKFITDYASLIELVRLNHPDAHIICMYGMMQASSTTQCKEAIEQAIKYSNDRNISSLRVNSNTDGAETHPNVKGHKSFAKKLVAKIEEYINK